MPELITIERPDTSALSAELDPLVAEANELVVDSIESHAAALEGYKLIKKAIKRIKEHFEPSRKALETAKKEVLHARDSLIEPFNTAMQIVSGKVDIYEKEEQRKAAEKARIEAEAERKWQEEARLVEAEAAEKAGDDKLADEIIERPVEVAAPGPVAPATVAKVAGVSTRTIYKAEVQNIKAFLRYVVNAPDGHLLIEPNASALNALARQQKEALSIPGVRVVTETVRSVR